MVFPFRATGRAAASQFRAYNGTHPGPSGVPWNRLWLMKLSSSIRFRWAPRKRHKVRTIACMGSSVAMLNAMPPNGTTWDPATLPA